MQLSRRSGPSQHHHVDQCKAHGLGIIAVVETVQAHACLLKLPNVMQRLLDAARQVPVARLACQRVQCDEVRIVCGRSLSLSLAVNDWVTMLMLLKFSTGTMFMLLKFSSGTMIHAVEQLRKRTGPDAPMRAWDLLQPRWQRRAGARSWSPASARLCCQNNIPSPNGSSFSIS